MNLHAALIADRRKSHVLTDFWNPQDPVTPPAGMTMAYLLGSDLIRYQYSTFPLTDDGATPRR